MLTTRRWPREKLSPRDLAFGTKRGPLDANFYEVFNRDDIELVDVREVSIQEITWRHHPVAAALLLQSQWLVCVELTTV